MSILVDAVDTKSAFDTFMSPDAWPLGVFCEKIFQK